MLCEGYFILHKRLKVLPVVTHVLDRLLSQTQVTSRVPFQLVPKGTEQAVPGRGTRKIDRLAS